MYSYTNTGEYDLANLNNNESVTKTIRDNASGSVQTNITKSGFTETRTTTVPVWTHFGFHHIALSLDLRNYSLHRMQMSKSFTVFCDISHKITLTRIAMLIFWWK
nr:hypothetical protein [Leptospira santarosai]